MSRTPDSSSLIAEAAVTDTWSPVDGYAATAPRTPASPLGGGAIVKLVFGAISTAGAVIAATAGEGGITGGKLPGSTKAIVGPTPLSSVNAVSLVGGEA
jgi:hypothetical protein